MENQFTKVGRRGEEKEQWEYKTTRKKQDGISKFLLSIRTLNVSGLTSPAKGHIVAGWLNKPDPGICYLQQAHFSFNDTHRLKVK